MKDAFPVVVGTGTVQNGGPVDTTIVVAQGTGKTLRLVSGYISVTTAATGGSGKVALEDGANGTRIVEVDANAAGFFPFVLGPIGYPLTSNTLLNLTCDTAATNQATARASVCCYVIG